MDNFRARLAKAKGADPKNHVGASPSNAKGADPANWRGPDPKNRIQSFRSQAVGAMKENHRGPAKRTLQEDCEPDETSYGVLRGYYLNPIEVEVCGGWITEAVKLPNY